MKSSQKIYNLYRQVQELELSINKIKQEKWTQKLEDAEKEANQLKTTLFECVGKVAAYEIEEENNKNKL